MSERKKIFISYSRKNIDHAEKLHQHLFPLSRTHGLHIFFDKTEIDSGDLWKQKISFALEACDAFIYLISPEFINSNFCMELELKKALERARLHKNIKLFPFLIIDCVYENLCPDEKYLALGNINAAGPFDDNMQLKPLEILGNHDSHWAKLVRKIGAWLDSIESTLDFNKENYSPRENLTVDINPENVAIWCNQTIVLDDLKDLVATRGGMLVLHGTQKQASPTCLSSRFSIELASAMKISCKSLTLLRNGHFSGAEKFEKAVYDQLFEYLHVDLPKYDKDYFSIERQRNNALTWLVRHNYQLVLIEYNIDYTYVNTPALLADQLKIAHSALLAMQALPVSIIVLAIWRYPFNSRRYPWLSNIIKYFFNVESPQKKIESAYKTIFPDDKQTTPHVRLNKLQSFTRQDLESWRKLPEIEKNIPLKNQKINQAFEGIICSDRVDFQDLKNWLIQILPG